MINIAILSAKGGTGKTTLAIALAHQYALANPDREVVLVDADNQGNVAISLDLRGENSLGAYLYRATDTLDLIQYRPEISFHVVESGRMHLYEAEKRIHLDENPVAYMKERLMGEFDSRALLIWDLPPTLSIINDNVLYLADYIVIPTHTDYLSLTGHVYTPAFLTAGRERWATLPADVRDVLEQTARETRGFVHETAGRMDEELLEELRAGGTLVNEVDREAFAGASEGIYAEFAAEVPGGAELVAASRALSDVSR